jgi:hypothetical protein
MTWSGGTQSPAPNARISRQAPRFVDAQYELALSAEQEAFSFELQKIFHVFPHNWQTRAIVSLQEKHDVMIRAGTE